MSAGSYQHECRRKTGGTFFLFFFSPLERRIIKAFWRYTLRRLNLGGFLIPLPQIASKGHLFCGDLYLFYRDNLILYSKENKFGDEESACCGACACAARAFVLSKSEFARARVCVFVSVCVRACACARTCCYFGDDVSCATRLWRACIKKRGNEDSKSRGIREDDNSPEPSKSDPLKIAPAIRPSPTLKTPPLSATSNTSWIICQGTNRKRGRAGQKLQRHTAQRRG